MRKFILKLLLLFIAFAAHAQKGQLVIQKGSTLNYTLYLHGQQVAFELKVKHLQDSLVLDWKMRNTTSGTYVILHQALLKADKLNFVQPEANRVYVLPSDQTFFMISKSAFNHMLQYKNFVYDNTVYQLDTNRHLPATNLSNSEAWNTLHVIAQNETTELWILNNPDFPLICRIKGNPLGIDMILNTIK
ncbi:hypothetical protein HH214_12675 [Mucilaginibacter robiniae]|uniref:DUF3108 domain-containing protein n=1 Tax=Mucilaginibacter robiniae TaxID=2728022 RepID=A0A7L5DZW7_9SPHI|nr:hypothetical protein [Mucilaginibacter robiniae]QJD96670.1 hypothetical protein HH214_12675 [Mucilaginibacter robiniae]